MRPGPSATMFDASSPEARAIAGLFTETLVICGVIGLVVAGLVGYCVVRFRAGKDGKNDKEPKQTHGNQRLEIIWTIIPLLILAWIFTGTVQAMGASDPPVDREPDLAVVGHQWWWEARYPNGAITANEIHVPVGKKLLVRVESADVIHDFWVPQLARKVDAVPGHPTYIWMQAEEPGAYAGTCAEYCGAEHAWMRIVVVADQPADFAAWVAHEHEPAPAPASEAAARGAAVFRLRTCVTCHAIVGTPPEARVAPDLTHLAERHTLGAGVIGNTPADLAHWLSDPQGVKPQSHMPDLRLTDEEVSDLVAYFETLR